MPAIGKPRYYVLLFVPFFLLYGLFAFASGYALMEDWGSIRWPLKLLAIAFLSAGLVLLFWTIRLLTSLGRHPAALKFSGASAAAFGALLIFGALSKVLPCSGPA